MKEVEAYNLFRHSPHIIHSIDHSVAADRGSGGSDDSKTVYVLLPYYRRGNLQDLINANLVNHTRFPEKRLMLLFLGVCRGMKDMHQYRPRPERMEAAPAAPDAPAKPKSKSKGKRRADAAPGADEDHETEQQAPLMAGEDDSTRTPSGAVQSYAHRDIKPGNIMISDSGASPILMDLGSLAASPLPITSRSLAVATQDTAAEHSTMPYRAPELFDVKTGTVIDTKVDIWSLGCTLYACLVGKSPFEARSDETGGSLSICVLSGDWRFPDEGPQAARGKGTGAGEETVISEGIREVVRRCLKVEPGERPDIDELIGMVEGVVSGLPEDDGA